MVEKKLEDTITKRKKVEEILEDVKEEYNDALMEWAQVCMQIGEDKLHQQADKATLDIWHVPPSLWNYCCFWKGYDKADNAFTKSGNQDKFLCHEELVRLIGPSSDRMQ